jgi:hypothetical protein
MKVFCREKGTKMMQNKLYTVIKGEKDSEGEMIRVKPTEYLLGLKAHEAINELQANVQSIAEQLEACSQEDLNKTKNIEKVRDLVFELEIAQGYLAKVFKTWQTRQSNNKQGPTIEC